MTLIVAVLYPEQVTVVISDIKIELSCLLIFALHSGDFICTAPCKTKRVSPLRGGEGLYEIQVDFYYIKGL
jgi:hypothetical protein